MPLPSCAGSGIGQPTYLHAGRQGAIVDLAGRGVVFGFCSLSGLRVEAIDPLSGLGRQRAGAARRIQRAGTEAPA
jgi:hypothetical protein